MAQKVHTSRIHLKRNSYESPYSSSKYSSSSRTLKTDRCLDSATSFKGLDDAKYESPLMKRIATDLKEDNNHTLNIPQLQIRSKPNIMTKALTERRNIDLDFHKSHHFGSFHKKRQTERPNFEFMMKHSQNIRRGSNHYTQADNASHNYYQIQNQYGAKRYQESQSILTQKLKRVNDLQRLNKFFLKRAEELSLTSQQLIKKNSSLKNQLSYYQTVSQRVSKLQDKLFELQKRYQNNQRNYQIQKQQIYTLTKIN